MFAPARSDDETDVEEGPARRNKIKSPNKPAITGSEGVPTHPKLKTRSVPDADRENQDDEDVADDDSEDDGKNMAVKLVGKPPTDIRKHAASLWVLFQTANEKKSLCFTQ